MHKINALGDGSHFSVDVTRYSILLYIKHSHILMIPSVDQKTEEVYIMKGLGIKKE